MLSTIGAEIITNTIVGVPYYDYSHYSTPQNPILIIKAPISDSGLDGRRSLD